MTILSLFNGMNCGGISLDELGITYDKYYSSEVEKSAIKMESVVFPDNTQLGDVRSININDLDNIGLLLAGSPCQSFSMAGKRNGMSTTCEIEVTTLGQYLKLKEEGFKFEGQSYLFWEFIRIKEELEARGDKFYFLLENVQMSSKWELTLNKAVGVFPVEINSSLVSAQNRKRLYWTNIPGDELTLFGNCISQPKDKGILLKDIIEHGVVDRDKSYCIDASYWKGSDVEQYIKKSRRQLVFNINCSTEKRSEESRKVRKEYMQKYGRDFSPRRGKELAVRKDQKANCLTGTLNYKEHALIDESINYRLLTPRECGRLQTVPELIIDKMLSSGLKKTPLYKMFGNGWTIEVVKHILKNLQH